MEHIQSTAQNDSRALPIPAQRVVGKWSVAQRSSSANGGVRAERRVVALDRERRRRWWAPLLSDGIRPLVLIGDIAAIALAGVLLGTAVIFTAVFTALFVAFQSAVGLYRSRLVLAVLDDVPRIVTNILLALSLTLLAVALLGVQRTHQPEAAIFAAGAAMLLVGTRLCSYVVVRRMRASRRVAHHTLVVGAGPLGCEIATNLVEHPEYGLLPVGFLESPHHRIDEALPLPLVGLDGDLPALLEHSQVRAVVLAHGHMPEPDLVDLIRTSHRARCEVFVVPRLVETHNLSHGMESVWATPLVRLRGAARNRIDWPIKRCSDIVLGLLALVLTAPVMAVCALAVYLEGGRGVIFRQERVGCDGRRFMLMKFRTLRPLDDAESQTQWNIAHDSRLGTVGRLLRKSSLDELPQLFNILSGEMSLVGPRPERPHFVEEFQARYPSYKARERVPCGLTGWAQIHGLRGDTSISERARFDNFYIENWSLWLDMKIMLRTTLALIRSPGA